MLREVVLALIAAIISVCSKLVGYICHRIFAFSFIVLFPRIQLYVGNGIFSFEQPESVGVGGLYFGLFVFSRPTVERGVLTH